MSEPVRILLLSNSIKEQLQKHTMKVVEAWSSRWGLFEGNSWYVEICSSLNDFEFGKIDIGSIKNNELFFCLSCPQSKHLLGGQVTQKKMASVNSKLLDSIVNKALSDFQMDYVLGTLSVDEKIVKTKELEGKLHEHIKNNNMVVVNLSANKFRMVLLLSMPLINILVEEDEVDKNQQALTNESPMRSIDDELVNLKVEYGNVDISVEELTTIRTGDVICLDKPISSPMSVSDQNGNYLFGGYLNVKEEKLVLKVTAKT